MIACERYRITTIDRLGVGLQLLNKEKEAEEGILERKYSYELLEYQYGTKSNDIFLGAILTIIVDRTAIISKGIV